MFSIKKTLKNAMISAAFLGGLAVSVAHAEPLVVKSGGPSAVRFPPGKKLAALGKITLKPGDVLTLLDSQGTRTLRGPGTFSISGAASADSGATTGLTALLSTSQSRRARTGAVRGVPGADSTKGRSSPNLWFVDIGRSATMCVPDLSNVQLWRPDRSQQIKVKLANMATGASAVVPFEKNQTVVPWPVASLPVVDGASYTLTWAGASKPVSVKLVRMTKQVDGIEGAGAALLAQGCQAQLDLLIETVALPDPAPLGGG
jgi:hypothetical protein